MKNSIVLFSAFLTLFLMLYTAGTNAIAQTNNYLAIDGSARFSAERDYGYSPLRYAGVEWGGGLTYLKQKSKKTYLVSFDFQAGNLINRYQNGMQVYSGSIVAYTFYHANKPQNSGLHWGWANNNEFGLRNNEAITNFNDRNDYFTSFGPALRYQLPFELFKRNFKFQSVANIQLLGFTVLSAYITSSPNGFVVENQPFMQSFLSSLGVFYPGNSINAACTSGIEYEFKSLNKLAFNYQYNYLRLKGEHLVQKSRGEWSISLIVRL